MADKEGASKVSRPTITLPPRASMESFLTGIGPGFSPGPMTLVSNFFSDNNYADSGPGSWSFSQLLAGAMGSPAASIAGGKPSFVFSNNNNNSTDGSAKEANCGDGCERNLGFKQNRPMNLVVAQSPMFMVPPGLSPSGLLNSPGLFSPLQSPFGMSHQQALAHVTAQAALSQSYLHMQDEYQPPSISTSMESSKHNPSFAFNMDTQQQIQNVVSEPESSALESSEVTHCDSKSVPHSNPVDKPTNDGYNWRKYGQKQVKKSEHPRSYYKCSSLNCPVKKIVEHNLDGQITEITYKGQHNHEQPQPTKRSKDGSDMNGRPEPSAHGQIVSRLNENVHSHLESRSDQVSTLPSHEQFLGSSDREEIGNAEIIVDDGEDDEPNPKRRETQVGASEVALSHKTASEARIIVQTRSEVDLLDDGYKWRKYGQKVVKGNPHPRSYYKCTYAGCNVRKHVERASTDAKAVITTYEGKHNHDVPAGRNSYYGTTQSNAMQVKQQKVVARKPALLKDTGFGEGDQMPVLLQLKEEQIIA